MAEAERLKALLKDDFIDDLSSGPLVPVQLPMVDTGTLFKKEKEEEAEEEIKNVKKKSKRYGTLHFVHSLYIHLILHTTSDMYFAYTSLF